VGARFSGPVPTSFLYNEYRFLPAVRKRPGPDAVPSPPFSAVVKKQSSGIPLLSLRAFVACEKGEPIYLPSTSGLETKFLSFFPCVTRATSFTDLLAKHAIETKRNPVGTPVSQTPTHVSEPPNTSLDRNRRRHSAS
jgi:hypothetical protein